MSEESKWRSVPIDYPRSQWRMRGNPLVERNRLDGVVAGNQHTRKARLSRLPPLDSHHLAFPYRLQEPEEC